MTEIAWLVGARPRPRPMWSVWKTGRLMDAEITEHRNGYELRIYIQGDSHYSRVHTSRELAEADAVERERELLAEGWIERPLIPTPIAQSAETS